MTLEEAKELVSYKSGLKNGTAALDDKILLSDIIQQAIVDKKNGTERKIDLKKYMEATKLLKLEKLRLAKEENQTYMAKIAAEDGVKITHSGLCYKILTQGNGASPSSNSSVTVHYKGTLIDGAEFDSSFTRNQPSTFQVCKVIKGWQEGLQLMTEGSTYKFYIPQELGYGDRGSGSNIPPFATLIFEVKLLEVTS